MRKNLTRTILAAALMLSAASAFACDKNRATGKETCVYGGAEHGWEANLQFATIDGEPYLLLHTSADSARINAKEVLFRIEGEAEPFRLPVVTSTSSSNCIMGAILFGTCMPATHVSVKLDADLMAKLAAADATYVAGADGVTIGPNVKLKGRQMRAWLERYTRASAKRTAAN